MGKPRCAHEFGSDGRCTREGCSMTVKRLEALRAGTAAAAAKRAAQRAQRAGVDMTSSALQPSTCKGARGNGPAPRVGLFTVNDQQFDLLTNRLDIPVTVQAIQANVLGETMSYKIPGRGIVSDMGPSNG